ncbi:sensor histidine kinase [Rubinisphaera margarita]|uniref:sensor histidine kinase n=1 Tax=Rubinisphaera margarita TaxID=2909586 RepID=UPI001EE781E1|nr:HAMP domain-containing sensor histidine kinase [Rubinisphaera margarita]MCG6158167.1 HAMP domain-containing histidine kinase [Rubinisphaera margarita]
MEEFNRTDEFLAMLGHEMKSSLSALTGALRLWSKDDAGVMDDLRHIMERQVRQLTRLSDDLLDTARIARGELDLRREPLSLQPVIREVCNEIRPLIDQCGRTLAVNMPETPIVIEGDEARLRQVFSNLLHDAISFTEQDGELEISLEPEADKVVVRIRDNPRGMNEESHRTLIGAGRRANSSTTSDGDQGIGMTLAKAIVEPHGGSVSVQNAGPGHGREFSVMLPRTNTLPIEQEAPRHPETIDIVSSQTGTVRNGHRQTT